MTYLIETGFYSKREIALLDIAREAVLRVAITDDYQAGDRP